MGRDYNVKKVKNVNVDELICWLLAAQPQPKFLGIFDYSIQIYKRCFPVFYNFD